MTKSKCEHLRIVGSAKLCEDPPVKESRCLTCPYNPRREFEIPDYDDDDYIEEIEIPESDYDEEEGLCHLDTTSPDDYEPEPILGIINF